MTAKLRADRLDLAQEVGSKDITVNLVQPGLTNWDMSPANGEYADCQCSHSLHIRRSTPEDVAAKVALLATPTARHVRHSAAVFA